MDIERVGATKAGSLVQWSMLRLACAEGCRTYHLGESGQSRPLAQFKESVGAVGIDYAEYRYERLPRPGRPAAALSRQEDAALP